MSFAATSFVVGYILSSDALLVDGAPASRILKVDGAVGEVTTIRPVAPPMSAAHLPTFSTCCCWCCFCFCSFCCLSFMPIPASLFMVVKMSEVRKALALMKRVDMIEDAPARRMAIELGALACDRGEIAAQRAENIGQSSWSDGADGGGGGGGGCRQSGGGGGGGGVVLAAGNSRRREGTDLRTDAGEDTMTFISLSFSLLLDRRVLFGQGSGILPQT